MGATFVYMFNIIKELQRPQTCTRGKAQYAKEWPETQKLRTRTLNHIFGYRNLILVAKQGNL